MQHLRISASGKRAFADGTRRSACAKDDHLLPCSFHLHIFQRIHKAIAIRIERDQFSVHDLDRVGAADLSDPFRQRITVIQNLCFPRHRDIKARKTAVLFDRIHSLIQFVLFRLDQNVIVSIHGELGKCLLMDHRRKTVRDRTANQSGQMSCLRFFYSWK